MPDWVSFMSAFVKVFSSVVVAWVVLYLDGYVLLFEYGCRVDSVCDISAKLKKNFVLRALVGSQAHPGWGTVALCQRSKLSKYSSKSDFIEIISQNPVRAKYDPDHSRLLHVYTIAHFLLAFVATEAVVQGNAGLTQATRYVAFAFLFYLGNRLSSSACW